jgi:anti-sigma-K factor RskA
MLSMRMHQNLAELEEAFVEEIEEDRERRERLARRATMRSRQRRIQKTQKHGSMRFAVLVLTLIATAVVVTIAMFQTLYYVMG